MRRREPEDINIDQLRKLGYEERDVSVNVLVKWLIGLAVFVGGSAAAAYGLYVLFVPREIPENTPHPLPETVSPTRLPPNPYPLIQPAPLASYGTFRAGPSLDIVDYRAQEDRRMTTPAWEDKQRGIVRIPVAQAMALLENQGLPTRPNPGSYVDAPAPGDYLAPEAGQPVRPDTPQNPAALPMGSTIGEYEARGPSSGRAELAAPGAASAAPPTRPVGPGAAARPDMTGRVAPGAGAPPNPPGTPAPTVPKPGAGATKAPSSNPSNQQTSPTPGINR